MPTSHFNTYSFVNYNRRKKKQIQIYLNFLTKNLYFYFYQNKCFYFLCGNNVEYTFVD